MDFSNKVVLITGASGGIGASCALRFAALNANLALVGRNVENLNNVAGKCKELKGNRPLTIKADISIDDDDQRIITETIDRYGKLDVLVNNAGFLIMSGITGDIKNFDKMVATNIRGTYLLTQKAVPHLLETKGNIVNVSSVVSMKPIPSMMAYSMTKAAMDIFTKCAALELGPNGVRVNMVNPGPVNTNLFTANSLSQDQSEQFLDKLTGLIPLKKIVTSDDVAKLISFLASEDANCITGTSHIIDCGIMLGDPNA
ncbi:estradiol 17-beta-dehydrogenase 8-like [Pieris rapae]|uniref:estradiol 17-beta-dehydrogenase 8-like n=1 Tax=Pieris rapae TaxID=64459 RepID=UPI001E27B0B9|nr:estradiol 17-beta-dehydrogenase 8-like [Pieris rapae]